MLVSTLDFRYVRSLFSYSEEEGIVYWMPRKGENNWNSKNAGCSAGYSLASGHIQIALKIEGTRFFVKRARLIMSIHNGKWIGDDLVVDHINRVSKDDRFINLRVCEQINNAKNRGINKNNTSGYKGVSLAKNGSWVAQIQVDNIPFVIGYYNCKKEAAMSYDEYAVNNFGEFAVTNKSLGLLQC